MSVAAGRAPVVGLHGGCWGDSTALTENIALRDKNGSWTRQPGSLQCWMKHADALGWMDKRWNPGVGHLTNGE